MNKIIIAGVACLLALGAVSCGDTKDTTLSIQYGSYYHVSRIDGLGSPAISAGTQSYEFNFSQGTLTMTSAPFNYNPTQKVSIGFSALPFTTTGYSYNVKPNNALTADNGMQVNDMNLTLSQYNVPPIEISADSLKWSNPLNSSAVILNCQLGSAYRVRTFWDDAVFYGNTNTTFTDKEGNSGSFSTIKPAFRIKMYFKSDELTGTPEYKASVIIYNAKFAQQQPDIRFMLLENLTLEFTNEGYVVKGHNIIPKAIMGQTGTTATPYPTFMFDSFQMTSTGDLTTASAQFSVAGRRYDGDFNGFWAVTPDNVKKFPDLFKK